MFSGADLIDSAASSIVIWDSNSITSCSVLSVIVLTEISRYIDWIKATVDDIRITKLLPVELHQERSRATFKVIIEGPGVRWESVLLQAYKKC